MLLSPCFRAPSQQPLLGLPKTLQDPEDNSVEATFPRFQRKNLYAQKSGAQLWTNCPRAEKHPQDDNA